MQEKSTTIAHSRTNLYTSSVTVEHIDNTNIHLLQYPSHEGDNKQQRVDYKGVPLYKGRKYHVSFKDEVKQCKSWLRMLIYSVLKRIMMLIVILILILLIITVIVIITI
jgi:hypothetical protein